jgi:uncharacterized protein (DUF58 family)
MMQPLIDDAFLRQLYQLRFVTREKRHGRLTGLHASPRAGVSLEFADYRAYTPGDDFRTIDWNVYGRLDRLVVRRYVHESDLPIYLLVDLSASMRIGKPPKAYYAARLAAGLAYLGLRGFDRVGIFPFTDRLLPTSVGPRHGLRQMANVLRALQDVRPGGKTSLDRAVRQFLAMSRENGLVLVISDFLTEDGYRSGIARLRHRGDELVAIQVLAPEEMRPTDMGAMQFVDVESHRQETLTVGRTTLSAYEERFHARQLELARFLRERTVPYFVAETDRPVERLIHEDLRRGGILR